MPATPWKALSSAAPDREYLALLSYLELKRFRMIPRFLRYSNEVQRQLSQTSGVVGYSLLAQLLRRHFWTLSVWDDERALMAFVSTRPHFTGDARSQGPHGADCVQAVDNQGCLCAIEMEGCACSVST